MAAKRAATTPAVKANKSATKTAKPKASAAKPKAVKAQVGAAKPKAVKAQVGAAKPKAVKAQASAAKPKAVKAQAGAAKPKAVKAQAGAAKPRASAAKVPAARGTSANLAKAAAPAPKVKATPKAAGPGAKPAKAAAPTPKAAVKAAAAGAKAIDEGDRAPEFSLSDQDGASLTSGELAGKPYVLYFYPKDDTPGCTREACDFQEANQAFAAAGVRVIGVSPDSTQRHARFRSKYGLGFTLLADTERTLAQAYGVWVMKQNYGREYMGIQRSTFLVDAAGRVKRAWRNVRVNGHAGQVLEAAR